MYRQTSFPIFAAACIALLTACHDPVADGEVSWLVATIHESEVPELDFTSRSYFNDTRLIHEGGRPHFGLTADGEGHLEGHRLMLSRFGAGRPAVGTYELAVLRLEGGRLFGFAAYYSRLNEENGRDAFNVRTGQLVVTKSTPNVVEGTFHFTAGLYCGGSPPGPCYYPWTVVPDAPEIEVAGSFSAVPIPMNENESDVGREPREGHTGTP